MEHIISVKSVGVLGVSSPISTFIIRLAINGTPFKIEHIKAQLSSSMDVSYKSYDERFGSLTEHCKIRQLSQVSNKNALENMVDEYLQTIQLEDENGYVVRKEISKTNITIPGFENIDALKKKIISDLNAEYTKYIDKTYIY